LKARVILSHARAENRKLRKELTLEVLTLKVPFRNLLLSLFLNRSLVAEANFSGNLLMSAASERLNLPLTSTRKYQIAGRARELQKAPRQPPNCSRFIVYTKLLAKVQVGIDFSARKFTGMVPVRRSQNAKLQWDTDLGGRPIERLSLLYRSNVTVDLAYRVFVVVVFSSCGFLTPRL
jgi:hypothetical protein